MEQTKNIAIKNLVSGIICRAINDWKKLCRDEAKCIKNKKQYDSRYICYCGETFQSIIDFFNSDYGFFLCDSVNVAPDRVITWMNSYRKSMIDDATKKGNKRGQKKL